MTIPNFTEDTSRLPFLYEKACNLPLKPGVYLMKDANGKIIYVGKSKALKNRVSQYFAPGADHPIKTLHMTRSVFDFDTILTTSETEALNLENQLIKLHNPRYNIKLKDDRHYPYIKITLNLPYPVISVVRKRLADNARYFGPYATTGGAYTMLQTLRKAFGLPSCKRRFPEDIGKGRPCLYAQLGQCTGVCTGTVPQAQYHEAYESAAALLSGSYREVEADLKRKMDFAAENLQFEAAALYRDRLAAIKKLWEKQRVVTTPDVEQDVFAFLADDACPVLTVLYIRGGMLIDSDSFLFSPEQLTGEEALTSLLFDLYLRRSFVPKEILLGFDLGEDNTGLLSSLLTEKAGYKVRIRTPERGDARALCKMALDNAAQYAAEFKNRTENENETLIRLAQLLSLEVVPQRIEVYDISNLGREHITAGKILCVDGKPDKSGYRTYRITDLPEQDDYAAMTEAVRRRLAHTEEPYPDLILLDGGKGHVSVIRALLADMGLSLPVFGLVKDDKHRTRALTDDREEIPLTDDRAVFVLLYGLQEEVHRYTVSRMTDAKRKTLRTSSLEAIPGIGPAKAKLLLRHFRSLSAVRQAGYEELAEVKGLSEKNIRAVLEAFAASDGTTKEKDTIV